MRTKKSFYNMITAMSYYICNLIFGLLNRKFILMILGVEYQGVNGLLHNILGMLNIAELGIGTAIVYHMYEPVLKNDIEKIKSLTRFYKKCYDIIMAIIFIVGCAVMVALPLFVDMDAIPDNIYILYFLMLIDAIASYMMAYKTSILYANQNNYVVQLVYLIGVLIYNSVQLVILYFTYNYYLFIIVKIIGRIAQNIALTWITQKLYPYLKDKNVEKLDSSIVKDVITKVKGLICHKVSSYIVTGTDNILISKFVGIAAVGIYSNYTLIIGYVNTVLNQITDSTTASVGNLLSEKNPEKAFSIFKELNALSMSLTTICASAFYCMFTPFISWVFGAKYTLDYAFLSILVLNFILLSMRRPYGVFKAAAGIQYEDRYVALTEAVLNLIVSIILLQLIGFKGVILGTSVSYLCMFFYTIPKLIYGKTFEKSLRVYVCQVLSDLLMTIISMGISFALSRFILPFGYIIQFFGGGFVAVAVSLGIIFIRYHNKPEWTALCSRMKKLIKK